MAKHLSVSNQGKVYREETQEEINQRLAEQMQVTYTLPNITREQELIALQTLEIEDLKDRISTLENGGV